MDGNGRWAEQRHYGRIRGHREGAKRVDEIVTECAKLGISHLTLYAFSTENWNRPRLEVNLLMQLLVQHLKTMDKKLLKNRIQLKAQGTLNRLPPYVQRELSRVIRATDQVNPKMVLCLSLSYGGRQEIIDAIGKIHCAVEEKTLSIENLNEETFRNFLYQPTFPDPDLLIRTGGEFRVSNFLLWQMAYTELYTANTLWPDFGVADLHQAIAAFAARKRRFGKTDNQIEEERALL